MTAPEPAAVFQTLESAGAQVRFVGGCVRDSLVGRPVNDVDIATDAEPVRVMALMQAAGFKTIPLGVDHGTVMVVVDGESFEITTLRRDIDTDGRRATVEFTDDWDADAARRDLTFNALSLEVDGTIHDPFDGVADLHAGRVRFVGDATTRIQEDFLRLLRYYRFFAHYGRPPSDSDARAACRALAPNVERLSGERIRAELFKLLAAPDPGPVLDMMRDDGVLRHVIQVEGNIERVARLVAVEAKMNLADPARRLFALLSLESDELRAAARRLRLSNAERDFLLQLKENAGRLRVDVATARLRHAIYRLGAPLSRELALLGWADDGDEAGWRAILDVIDAWTSIALPVSGADVLTLGVEPGAMVGAHLRRVEEWWIDGDFKADRDACLAHLAGVVSDG
ncbi:MAG: CCA tRNA nucleotidyltransferase [Rhodospirillaceae bacterium]|nr:CCA tRNA nucleotidyltransferase [Rhodospirillaceae bacterium]MBT5664156.1 CCA tRNA nucleotidyltransferase [Rhodospirillaceae bacterium]MBT5812145.1 CCA tRNA nucleotidyltransferase [Rhodospirillaceae bacterium]